MKINYEHFKFEDSIITKTNFILVFFCYKGLYVLKITKFDFDKINFEPLDVIKYMFRLSQL